MPRSETRACREVRRARWKYQSTGVVRNSAIATAASSGSGTGNMKPVWVSTSTVRGPTGSREVIGVSARPPYRRTRERFTVIARAATCGRRSGPSMVANVSPGTPATANSPETRSGWRTASSNMVFTPIDQPTSTRPVDAEVVHDGQGVLDELLDADPLGVGGPVRAAGAAVVPRDDADPALRVAAAPARPTVPCRGRCRAPRSGRRAGPSGSLVQARRRVPSSESTSWNAIDSAVAARAAEAGMRRLCPSGPAGRWNRWLSSPGTRGGGPPRRTQRLAGRRELSGSWAGRRSPARALDLGGEELLDLVELHTTLCEGVGGDHGVAPGPLLGHDRPANGGGDQGVGVYMSSSPMSAWSPRQ